MFAPHRSILLLTAAVLIGGCAHQRAYEEARQRYIDNGCQQYEHAAYLTERSRKLFDLEAPPPECRRPSRPQLAGYKRVTIYDAETGRTTSAIVPAGTVIVK